MQIRESDLLSPQLPENQNKTRQLNLTQMIAQSQFGIRLSNGLLFSSCETKLQEKHTENQTIVTSEGSLMRPEMKLVIEQPNLTE